MVSDRCGSCWIILAMVLVLSAVGAGGATAEKGVTYDGRSLIIDGQRKLLFSGSIHYPRSTPEVNIFHHMFMNVHMIITVYTYIYSNVVM